MEFSESTSKTMIDDIVDIYGAMLVNNMAKMEKILL
jgi:hypothetical protein